MRKLRIKLLIKEVRKLNKTIAILTVAVAAIFTATASYAAVDYEGILVKAKSLTDKNKPVLEKQTADRSSKISERQTLACEKAVEKAKSKIASYGDRKAKVEEIYAKAKAKVEEMIAEKEDQRESVEDLKNMVNEIDVKVENLFATVDATVAKWEEMPISCSDTAQLEALRNDLKADILSIKEDIKEIRTLISSLMDMLMDEENMEE
jgi:chromosome segregation ATPase